MERLRQVITPPVLTRTYCGFLHISQALAGLQHGIDDAIARRSDADARGRDLEAALDAEEEEITLLHERLSLGRRFLQLAHEWSSTQQRLHDTNER